MTDTAPHHAKVFIAPLPATPTDGDWWRCDRCGAATPEPHSCHGEDCARGPFGCGCTEVACPACCPECAD